MALVEQQPSKNAGLNRLALPTTASAWISLLATLVAFFTLSAQAQSKEYQVKAAFLLNFANFVHWPPAAFAGTNAPILIGVLGADPFGPALEETIQGEIVHGSRLAIERSHRAEDLTKCQMVFISKSEKARLDDVLPVLAARPILMVSEIEGFAQRGGTINFYREQGKVRFELNPAAAQQQGLKLSSELLSLGKIVKTDQQKTE